MIHSLPILSEFNRISIEVLSVIAVQVKCIQDALKVNFGRSVMFCDCSFATFRAQNNKSTFVFMGESIALVPTVGLFVTMNPGYAGRTELRMLLN